MEQNQYNNTRPSGNDYHKVPVSKNTILVLVIAVVVAVLSFMYVWGSKMDSTSKGNNADLPPIPTTDAQTEAFNTVNPSDDIEAIEQDLSATNVDQLDADLEQMEAEINVGLSQ